MKLLQKSCNLQWRGGKLKLLRETGLFSISVPLAVYFSNLQMEFKEKNMVVWEISGAVHLAPLSLT